MKKTTPKPKPETEAKTTTKTTPKRRRKPDSALLTIEDKRRFLAELIRTPSGDDGPKLADKLRAIELDSKLANHFGAEQPDDQAPDQQQDTAEAMREIAERVRKVLPVMWGAARQAGE